MLTWLRGWLKSWWVTLTLPHDVKQRLSKPMNPEDFIEIHRPETHLSEPFQVPDEETATKLRRLIMQVQIDACEDALAGRHAEYPPPLSASERESFVLRLDELKARMADQPR